MKKTLTLGTLLLGCWLAAVAQTGSTPNQTPPMSTPPTFSQDKTGPTPWNPTPPVDRSTFPPDTKAPGQSESSSQASNFQATTVEGCLSQSPEGNFMLADNSGSNFQLHGDTLRLKGYIGKEVQVEGTAMSNRGAPPSAMASPSSDSSGSSPGAATQFNVSKVDKVADTCATGSGTNK
jgi:hypothetical protein